MQNYLLIIMHAQTIQALIFIFLTSKKCQAFSESLQVVLTEFWYEMWAPTLGSKQMCQPEIFSFPGCAELRLTKKHQSPLRFRVPPPGSRVLATSTHPYRSGDIITMESGTWNMYMYLHLMLFVSNKVGKIPSLFWSFVGNKLHL